jgi:formiminotetrahydrofolate cyclodeaminase
MALRVGHGEDPWPVAELERLRVQLLAAVEADASAYGAWREAQAAGADLSAARQASIEVPAGIAAASLAALEVLHRNARGIRPSLLAEVRTATRALLAAVEAASFTALVNQPASATCRELAGLCARARALAGELEACPEAPSPSA